MRTTEVARQSIRLVPTAESADGGDVRQGARLSAATVVHARLREQVAELRRRGVEVRQDTPDGVHQMRVAARRLRSALVTFRPLLDRRVGDDLRGELGWLSEALGAARDAEVMHERLSRAIATEPAEFVFGPVGRRVDEELLSAYREGRARALKAMDSRRYHRLEGDLEALFLDPPWTSLAERPARDVLPERVRRDWERLRRRVASAGRAPDVAERYERLHEARKAAKRLRYAAETLVCLNGRHARRMINASKRVQTVLGELHDAAVTQDALRRLATRARSRGEDTFTYGLLHAREQARVAAAEAEFAAVWEHASRSALRQWLS